MLLDFIIGHIGADAEVKTSNGREFTTFRIANTERWKDDSGEVHESTEWVDCVINGRPNVLPWLKRGQQVSVVGQSSLRVYSSKKDRCMKAGRTVNIKQIELIGSGNTDTVPSRLYDADGVEHQVFKLYYTDVSNTQLFSTRGEEFTADKKGLLSLVTPPNDTADGEQQ